jgi:hypothetical protein
MFSPLPCQTNVVSHGSVSSRRVSTAAKERTINKEVNMQFLARPAYVAGFTAVILSLSATALAQTATFSDVTDAVPGRFFDAAATLADEADPNTLVIGINEGFDFRTWKFNDFRASTLPFSHTSAMDTITFIVQAPEGYYISSITYSQRGAGSVLRTGKAAGMANWVVGEYAADLGVFGSNPTLSGTADLAELKMTRVPVSISSSLFSFSTPALGAASVALTSADVRVELLLFEVPPIEVPPVDVPPVDVPPVDVPPVDVPPVDVPPIEVSPLEVLPLPLVQ